MSGILIIPVINSLSDIGFGENSYDVKSCYGNYLGNYCDDVCGQLNPLTKFKENATQFEPTYNLLKDIYDQLMKMFNKPDIISLGDTAFQENCWQVNKDTYDNEFENFLQHWVKLLDGDRIDKIKVILKTCKKRKWLDNITGKERYIINVRIFLNKIYKYIQLCIHVTGF